MIHKTFRIPNGYSTKEKTSTLDIERVLNVLLSRKRKKYISAHRKNYEPFAELKSEIWQCPYCNYETNELNVDTCPNCGEKMDQLSRITGYLVSTTDRWNSGKKAELDDRVNHT